ncbi:hypothetical protein [Paraglaciecola sp.]|uniref:FG-GAP repeat domain-containing protein n=1 Tax=Paraglaciecola sp. TaxID=1920173 RepID=UPI00329A3624
MYANLFLLLVLFLITACGGGSSSSTSNPSDSLQPISEKLFSEYKGISTKASVTAQNSHSVAYHVTLITDVVSVLVFGDELKKLRFDALVSNYDDYIYDDCESGSLELVAISNNTADVSYTDCLTGPYIINGDGKLTIDELDEFDELSLGTLEFESLSVSSSLHGTEHVLKGDVVLDFSSGFESSLNLLITETNTDESYYLHEFTSRFSASESDITYAVDGRLYISTFGYLDLTTITSPDIFSEPEDNTLAIKASGDADLLISVTSASTISLALEQAESLYAVSAEIPYSFFIQKEFESSNNQAPNIRLAELGDLLDKNTNIALDASASFDDDYDLISFNWSVLDSPDGADFQLNGSIRDIATLVSNTAGTYQLSVVVSDGQLESDELTFSFYVRKDPANVTIVGSTDNMTIGTPVEFDLVIDNPADDGPFEIEQNHGPASMTYEPEIGLIWDGNIPDFGTDTAVNFGVTVTNSDHVVVARHQSLVTDTKTKPSIFLTGYSSNQSWQDVNGDNVKDLLLLYPGVIEAWDFSGSIPQLLFTYLGTVESWEFATYDETDNVLIAKSVNGEFYSYDPSSDTASLLFIDEAFTSREWTAILVDLDDDGVRELVTDKYVRNATSGERLHSFNLAFSSAYTSISLSDVDGDGVSELLIGSDIFNKNTFEFIADIEGVNLSYFDQAFWYDIDGDNKVELLLALVSTGVEVYDFENGQLQLKQSVHEHQDPDTTMSLSSLPDFSELYITSNSGTSITRYSKNEQGIYLVDAEMNITDPNLYSPSNDNYTYSSCRLSQSFENIEDTTILLECSKAYTVDGGDDLAKDYISIIPFGEEIYDLPYDFASDSDLGVFDRILASSDDSFTVGAARGVVSIDDELSVSSQVGRIGAVLRDSYVSYGTSTLIDDVLLGWDIDTQHYPNSSVIYGFDIQGNEVQSSPSRSRLSDIVGIVENNGQQVLVTSEYQTLVFWSLPDLDIVAEVEFPTDDSYSWSFNDISYWRFFTFNETYHLAFLLEDKLVLVKAEDDSFVFDGTYELPSGFDGEDNSIFEPIKIEDEQYLVLMQSNPTSSLFDKATFNLTDKTFSIEQTALPADIAIGYSGMQSCMNTLDNGSTVAYVHTSEIDVESGDIDNNSRQYKVIALDIQSNEIVWSSRKLPGRYNMANDMKCSNGNTGQQITLSTTDFFYLAD